MERRSRTSPSHLKESPGQAHTKRWRPASFKRRLLMSSSRYSFSKSSSPVTIPGDNDLENEYLSDEQIVQSVVEEYENEEAEKSDDDTSEEDKISHGRREMHFRHH
ncbi:hypothetical protein J6590_073980 [Homalodisca vitripennis]|nr:hypothetical protein J6590_073980 [Homalodisca vitripennis]